MFTSLLGFGLISYFLNFIPLELLLLPLYQACSVRVYSFWKKEDCLTLQKTLENWTRRSHDGKGYGYALSLYYYAYLAINTGLDTQTYSAWIICTEHMYKSLFKDPEPIKIAEECTDSQPIQFKVLRKASGSFANTYYRKDTGLIRFIPTAKQQSILESIENRFKQNNYAVVLITGAPNKGKSMIGVFLAQKLNGYYCNEFTPWIPGDSLALLSYDHDEQSPLIISLDEIDDALVKISSGSIPTNQKLIISTPDKKGWNTMFDNIERSIQKNVIIIMTSNLSRDEISKKCNDESFLRKPRVTDYFEMS
jgi:hypothetical protein